MSTVIRIPRTTVQFIVGLREVLRDHMGFEYVGTPEHWTFDNVNNREECGNPGYCAVHGYADKYENEIREAYEKGEPSRGMQMQDSIVPCHGYQISVYLGVGQMHADGQLIELRTRIERTQSDYGANMTVAHVWVKGGDSPIRKGAFYLPDGMSQSTMKADEAAPLRPPSKIAFSKKSSDIFPEDKGLSGRSRQKLFDGAIIVERRPDDWMAFIVGHRELWGCSRISPFAAVRELLKTHPEATRKAMQARR